MKYISIIFILFSSLPVFGRIDFSGDTIAKHSRSKGRLSLHYRQSKSAVGHEPFAEFNRTTENYTSSLFSAPVNSSVEILLAGDLDTNFGVGGKVTTQFANSISEALAVAFQTDGKFVLVGYGSSGNSGVDFALARYNANGTLDTSFGASGKVLTDIANADNAASALAVQPADGKLIAAGSAFNGRNDDFALVRYKTDGTLDETFGVGGIVTTNFNNSFDYITAIALQPDGKIVVAGYLFSNSYFQFALARYNTDGTLDGNFGSGGRVTTRLTDFDDLAWAIALQPDGKIVAAGEADTDFAIVRYNSDGSLDTTFDGDGKARTSLVKFDSAYGVALQPDGKIVAAGEAGDSFNSDFALVRYNADGSLDNAFGAGGKATTPVGSGNEIATSLAIQTDGKITVGGFSFNGNNDDFALVNYNSNGTLDSSFGAGGKVLTNFSASSSDHLSALAVNSGRIIAVGSTNADFAVAAYLLGANACSYTLSASSTAVPASGGTGEFTVTTDASCSRTAVSSDSFVAITGGANGTGSGTIAFTAAANTGLARVGTISVGGQTFTINQAGGKSRKRTRFF